jgi:hypothetical protein
MTTALRRAILVCSALYAEWLLLCAQIRADSALHCAKDAADEYDRAERWLVHQSQRLAKAQRVAAAAQYAVKRHDRHAELGILE